MSVILGIGFIYAGVKNFYKLYQLLNSSLDAVYSEVEFSTDYSRDNTGFDDNEQDPFLPIINSESPSSAPDLAGRSAAGENQEEVTKDSNHSGSDLFEQAASPAEIQLLVPERMVIKSIEVNSPIIPVSYREVEYLGEIYQQWIAPRSGDLGWHSTSAKPGEPSNVVINGHNSGYGETFRYLDQLESGDLVEIYAGDFLFTYIVSNSMVLKERWESIDTRMENASWINPSDGSRLTLISCWPYNSSTHRVVVVAVPYSVEKLVVGLSGN